MIRKNRKLTEQQIIPEIVYKLNHGMFFKDEIIKFNPFKRVKAPILTEARERKPFLMEEMFQIIDAMPKLMQCYFAIGFFTGMRTGEIIGLKWKDVDWDERIIKVRRSRRQGMETKPKTKSSIREVDILDALLPYLKQHQSFCGTNTYIFET